MYVGQCIFIYSLVYSSSIPLNLDISHLHLSGADIFLLINFQTFSAASSVSHPIAKSSTCLRRNISSPKTALFSRYTFGS